ncbi:hypothetical protein MTsPCn9_18590 [Croceitalea sp. MTPC9]|uniref:hypothetical protein n=1 Tax=unclassified Croceitalea TaxID=2632280 RepID=UPI002B3F9A09|nr:hypothetical protein MTsPCn6_11440 [Croceitalea sp. MTPC6]GMN16923.1 hypothetical protein MTsPCn9_18590 [Croceitalea sp. MTPC9]
MNLKKFNPFKISKATGTNDIIQLVEGSFSPAEAADVLLSLINYKIKFHSVQILNLKEIEKDAVKKSEKRIEELKDAKNKVTELVLNARKKGENLKINSTITVTTEKITAP